MLGAKVTKHADFASNPCKAFLRLARTSREGEDLDELHFHMLYAIIIAQSNIYIYIYRYKYKYNTNINTNIKIKINIRKNKYNRRKFRSQTSDNMDR